MHPLSSQEQERLNVLYPLLLLPDILNSCIQDVRTAVCVLCCCVIRKANQETISFTLDRGGYFLGVLQHWVAISVSLHAHDLKTSWAVFQAVLVGEICASASQVMPHFHQILQVECNRVLTVSCS